METLKAACYKPKEEDVRQRMAALEMRTTDTLTTTNVCLIAAALPEEQQAKTALAEAFACFDKFKDGTITVLDLRLVLTNAGDLKQDEIDCIEEELDPIDMGRVYIDDVIRCFSKKML